MFNNLTNFLNLITNRKIKTAATIEDTDLIPLGTQDPTFLGGYQPTAITYKELVDSLPVDGVASISDNGTGVVTVDNTDPENPVIDFNGVNVDNVTITGDGTTGSPLTAVLPPLGVQSVTGLNTDNTDPLNPIVELSVDGVTVTGDGTPGNPLAATGQSTSPTVQVVLFADLATTEPLKPCTYNNGVAGVGATLTGNANGQLSTISFPDKIDNVTTALNQVILVRAQSSGIQNGVYLVTQLGSPTQPFILTRTVDADTQAELYPIQVNVFGGVTFANRAFLQSTIDPVVGTSAIVFTGAQIGIQNTPVLHMDTVTSGALPSCTYTPSTNPSLPGVGATLVATTNGALPAINGVTLTNGRRLLVKDQANQAHNGSYTVASIGSVSTPWRLVRAEGWGGNFTILDKEWKINNPASTKYGARYSTNLLSLSNLQVGIANIVFTEVTTGGLPPWVETDATDLTIWCNGKGDIASNTGFGENSLQANTIGTFNTAIGTDALSANTTGQSNTAIGFNSLAANTINSANTAVGDSALRLAQAQANTAVGYWSSRFTTVGSANTTIGMSSGLFTTTGSYNTAIGNTSLYNNTTGENNTAIGKDSLFTNVIGSNNTAVGKGSLRSNTASENTAVGTDALFANSSGFNNSSLGYNTLRSNTTGSNNTAIGREALRTNVSNSNNTAVGTNALRLATADGNTAVGQGSLERTTTGSSNSALGKDSLNNNTTGTLNTAVGSAAMFSTTTGTNNVAVGSQSLFTNTTGSGNIAVGTEALTSNSTGDGNIAIGNAALKNFTSNNSGIIAIGNSAMFNATQIGNGTIAIGIGALNNYDNPFDPNLAIGTATLQATILGHRNTAVGTSAMFSNNAGSLNAAFGQQSLQNNTTGDSNTAIGTSAVFSNTTGSNNVGVGQDSLLSNTTGNNNTAVGTATSTNNFSGSVILGFAAASTASNQFVVGSAGTNAGSVVAEVNTSSNVWNVVINGVPRKILLA